MHYISNVWCLTLFWDDHGCMYVEHSKNTSRYHFRCWELATNVQWHKNTQCLRKTQSARDLAFIKMWIDRENYSVDMVVATYNLKYNRLHWGCVLEGQQAHMVEWKIWCGVHDSHGEWLWQNKLCALCVSSVPICHPQKSCHVMLHLIFHQFGS